MNFQSLWDGLGLNSPPPTWISDRRIFEDMFVRSEAGAAEAGPWSQPGRGSDGDDLG